VVPSPPPAPPAVPALGALAELVHHACAAAPGPRLVELHERAGRLALGTWSVPPEVDHPADPLVGHLAAPSCLAVGLVTGGRAGRPAGADHRHELPGHPSLVGPVRVTVVADRHGGFASVLAPVAGLPQVLTEAPSGWVADALARALGRPTPPPADRLARWAEGAWLDAVAGAVLAAPGRAPTWAELAHRHPLHPPGPALPGALLAVEAEALELTSSWTRLRRLWAPDPRPPVATHPGGTDLPPARWFDDGSFSRWVQRHQPPAEPVLEAVLDALPRRLGGEVLDALITVAPPAWW
jgi:hypothetical protein